MATNVSATEVRYVGNWSSTEFSDTMLASAAYILAGDGWLNKIVKAAGYASLSAFTTANADAGALAKAAECYYVAALVTAIPQKEDFAAGNVKSTDVRNSEKKAMAEFFMSKAKEMLSKAGLTYEAWTWTYTGGDDYHPDGDDDTNVDFGAVTTGRAFQLLGGGDEE
jgi:hypothetical protein